MQNEVRSTKHEARSTRHLFILLFLLFSFFERVEAQTISESAQFSILTVGVGEELYSAYGHSALRIKDLTNKVDIVFNWGTFNFNTPNFYMKFARGKLDYLMAAETFESFIVQMQYEERPVFEQVVNLSYNERKKLFDLVVLNFQPENRSYKYDFLFDNCATRIRDLILRTIDNKYFVDSAKSNEIVSFRQLNIISLNDKPWIQAGIDLMLGMKADDNAGFYYGMYLPDYMHGSFNAIYRTDSTRLVSSDNLVFDLDQKKLHRPWFTPFVLFIIIAFLMILAFPISQKIAFWADGIFFTILGLVGVLIGFMWFVSEHIACDQNLNLLWALPFNAFYFLWVLNKKISKYYFSIVASLAILFLLSMPFLPQKISITFVPLIVLVAARALNRAFETDNKLVALFIKRNK